MKDRTREEARAFIRKVMGPPMRTIEGQEKERLLLMFALMDPVKESNNQHSWSADYCVGHRHYSVTTFPEQEDPIVEEYLEDDSLH